LFAGQASLTVRGLCGGDVAPVHKGVAEADPCVVPPAPIMDRLEARFRGAATVSAQGCGNEITIERKLFLGHCPTPIQHGLGVFRALKFQQSDGEPGPIRRLKQRTDFGECVLL